MPTQVDQVTHGAIDFAELERLGIHPDDVLDFSVNSNPFGPSPAVWDAIRSTPLDRYPDRESILLRRALSKRLDIPFEQIIMGNGTAELIQLAAFALLQKSENVLIAGPTFGEYERSARLMNANIRHWCAVPEDGFGYHPDEIQKELTRQKFRMVFLCNPNNPTGQALSLDVLDAWARAHPDTLFVLDEAYLAFAPGMKSATTLRHKNILILCSMTKDYAIAGIRLGYAVADESIVQALVNVRPAWNVSALAQSAGLVALEDEAHQRETLTQLQQEKHFLISGLQELGFIPVPSHTHYFLMPVHNGAEFRQALLKHGILVRDCASFGLPGYIRISAQTREQNIRLLKALKAMIE